MRRLTEFRKDLNRYEYKQDERGYCFIQEGQLVQKLGKLEDLEEQIGCPLEEIVEFVKLLKKYYYVDITGQLMARTIWNNTDLNEKELYKINHIFNGIKDKSE